MSTRTLVFRSCPSPSGPYIVLLHTAAAPMHEEWRDYVNLVRSTVAEASQLVHAFVATDGGSPNALQRRSLADAIARGGPGMQTHVFTTDVVIRSVVTAFSWISKPGALAYAPREFSEVCRKCRQSPGDVIHAFAALQTSLPRVDTLDRIVKTLHVREAS